VRNLPHRLGQISGAGATVRVLGAQSSIVIDLFIDHLRFVGHVSRRIDGDHRRAVDVSGILPGIIHRQACAIASTEQVELLVTQGVACDLYIVYHFDESITSKIDTLILQS